MNEHDIIRDLIPAAEEGLRNAESDTLEMVEGAAAAAEAYLAAITAGLRLLEEKANPTEFPAAPAFSPPTWDPPSHWDEHIEYPAKDWAREVDEESTRLGYHEWVNNQLDLEVAEGASDVKKAIPTSRMQYVREILADHLGLEVEQVLEDSDIVQDLGADSLDVVEIIMEFEEAFNLEIDEDEVDRLTTPLAVVGYLDGRLA